MDRKRCRDRGQDGKYKRAKDGSAIDNGQLPRAVGKMYVRLKYQLSDNWEDLHIYTYTLNTTHTYVYHVKSRVS